MKKVIIAAIVIVTVAVIVAISFIENSKRKFNPINMKRIILLCEKYKAQKGVFPANLDDLIASGMLEPAGKTDRYGREYVFVRFSDKVVLISKGKDGIIGNEDDREEETASLKVKSSVAEKTATKVEEKGEIKIHNFSDLKIEAIVGNIVAFSYKGETLFGIEGKYVVRRDNKPFVLEYGKVLVREIAVERRCIILEYDGQVVEKNLK